jgi:general nucleoside transport system permease protein
MSNQSTSVLSKPNPDSKPTNNRLVQWLLNTASMPLLAVLTAFILGGVVIWITSGSLQTVWLAYQGMLRGAFFKERGLSESLVATTPYIFLGLAVAVGFKTGLFNIGVEGQFYIGSICGAFVGQAITGVPAILHLPITLGAAALGGGIWAAIPGFLKAKTGAHEVITTIMMNYISFRLVEYLVSGPIKDQNSTTPQTPPAASSAWVWSLASIPQRLQDPLNALGVALFLAFLIFFLARWFLQQSRFGKRFQGTRQKNLGAGGAAVVLGAVAFVVLPVLTKIWWPFTDQYDRLHIGLILALCTSVLVWWLLWKTSLGFELRMVGANANAARYAGISITRSIVVSMAISGALAGIAGSIEVLGVSTCHCMPMFFSSGYGFDAIAISLLAKNNPFGILAASFLFGAMRNGADLMELSSGVSKYIISVIQALALLFVAAPAIIRSIYRIKDKRRAEEEAPKLSESGGKL